MVAESFLDAAKAWLPLAFTAVCVVLLGRFMTCNHSLLRCCRLRIWIGWLMNHLSLCHRMYIRSRRPFRIILMRHAESEGNVDKCVYSSTPDHALKITERGKRQAAVAGSELKKLIGDESVYFIVSPYTRTRMTYEIIKEELGQRQFAMREDPRLRELDFGNFQDLATMQETMETRKAYGRFWFRFMNGESCSDVYDRATAFWESVFRSMDNSAGTRYQNYVIVTHGLMMRLILMRYFQWKVEFFERVWNPSNCETWVMERDERGSYRVVTEILDRPTAATASMTESSLQMEAEESACGTGAARTAVLDGSGGDGNAEVQGMVGAAARTETGANVPRRKPSIFSQPQEGQSSPPQQQRQQQHLLFASLPHDGRHLPTVGGSGSGSNERQDLRPTTDSPLPPGCLKVGAHARGGSSGLVDGGLFEPREEEEEEEEEEEALLDTEESSSSGTTPHVRKASAGGRGGFLVTRNHVSALSLLDGGFAPGEEGCGRDEEL